MKKFKTYLMVFMEFEQERQDGEIQRPDEFIEEEIEQTFGCKARIIERTDREIEG